MGKSRRTCEKPPQISLKTADALMQHLEFRIRDELAWLAEKLERATQRYDLIR